MEVFKGEERKDKKGISTFDFKNDEKHLLFGMSELGYLTLGFYYENPDKEFWFTEDFLVDKSNYHIYKMMDDLFFSYGGETFFSTEGANLTLTKDEDGYRFNFEKDFRENKRIIESKFFLDTVENRSMYNFFEKLQEYDPRYHQVHMSELERPKTMIKK